MRGTCQKGAGYEVECPQVTRPLTALTATLLGVKDSTKDIDFMVPDESEYI